MTTNGIDEGAPRSPDLRSDTPPRRKTAVIAAGVAVTGVVLALAAVRLSSLATGWLLSGEPPIASELMVVLSGASMERTQTALELYRAGMAPEILITGETGPDVDLRFLEEHDVPRQSLLLPLQPATSTFEDALSVRQLVLKKGVKSILVVTSPYHCRRARLILSRVLSGLGVRITVTPSVSLYMDPDHWWRSRQGWITAGFEFPKILWAWGTVPTVSEVGP